MKSIAIIIPVKSTRVKSRLSLVLTEAQRREFETLLLSDVLGVLKRAGLVAQVSVVSSDRGILRLAETAGARGVPEQGDRGVNAAVLSGMEAAAGAARVAVLPSDLPLLTSSQVRDLLALSSAGLDVAIAPSLGFDGTNALAFSPGSGPALSYDDNSFWNHLYDSARRGLSVGVCCERGLMFDVDSPADFDALATSASRRPSAEFARRVMR